MLSFGFWPYENKPVIVLSKSLTEIPAHLPDSVCIDQAEPRAFVERLIEQGYEHIYLDGGQVIQSFLREGLVDEITLTIIPVLIGAGIPLFGFLEKDIRLALLESRSWANGMVQSKYRVIK